MSPASARFTLHHLEVLVAVGETGTVTAAAERMHMSPSAVSSALTELENRLAMTLMVRRRAKGVTLTADGTAVLTRARMILKHTTDLQLGAAGSGPLLGHLRVGCFPSLAPTMLPALVTEYLAINSEVTLDFREGDQVALQGWLASGEIDLAIVYDVAVPFEWTLVPIGTSPMHLVLAGDHPLAEATRPIDLGELRDEPMIMLDLPPSAPRILDVCARSGFTPVIAYRTPSYETARSFVGRGLGWTLLHQRLPTSLTYEGFPLAIKEIGSPWPEPLRVAIAHRSDTPLSRAADAFVSLAVTRQA